MVIEHSLPHKYHAGILSCYHKEKCLILLAIKTSSFVPAQNARGRLGRDYHCDRYTHLKTLDIIIITTVSLQYEQLICFLTVF